MQSCVKKKKESKKRTVLRTELKKSTGREYEEKEPPPGNRSIDGSINHYHTAGVLYKCARDAGDWKCGIPNPRNNETTDLGECSSFKSEKKGEKKNNNMGVQKRLSRKGSR